MPWLPQYIYTTKGTIILPKSPEWINWWRNENFLTSHLRLLTKDAQDFYTKPTIRLCRILEKINLTKCYESRYFYRKTAKSSNRNNEKHKYWVPRQKSSIFKGELSKFWILYHKSDRTFLNLWLKLESRITEVCSWHSPTS